MQQVENEEDEKFSNVCNVPFIGVLRIAIFHLGSYDFRQNQPSNLESKFSSIAYARFVRFILFSKARHIASVINDRSFGFVDPYWFLSRVFVLSSKTRLYDNKFLINADVNLVGRARECKLESDCAGIQNTTCIADSRDGRTRCLCGDYSAPLNGACINKFKGNNFKYNFNNLSFLCRI